MRRALSLVSAFCWAPAGLAVLGLLLVSGAGGRPLGAAPAGGKKMAKPLVANGSFEEGSGMLPDGWRRGAPVPGVEYLWDRAQAKSGKSSLCLRKTAPRYFPVAQVAQALPGAVPDRLKISAWVKAQGVTKATVDAQWEEDGEPRRQWVAYLGARKAGDPPADHDWKEVEGVIDPGPGAKNLRVALQIYGPGTVWFDDVRAAATSDAARTADLDPAEPVRTEERRAGNDPDKRYFLIGPRGAGPAPEEGYRLLVVLPGGDGGAGFLPFVRSLAERAASDRYLVAQLVAPAWTQDENRIIWPTERVPVPEMKFSTEAFIRAVVQDVRQRHSIDPKCVFTLGWSSGGPPCYAVSLQKESPFTGTFVAMSVFKPAELPGLGTAKGHAYYLLHSPQDFIPIRMAEDARDTLRAAGAAAELSTYEGGHGWRGDVFGNVARGLRWLEERRGVTPSIALPPATATPAAPANPLEELWKRIEDPSLERQVSGFRALLPYAFQDFAEDYTAYRQWHARYRDVPEAEIIRENCRAFMERLKKAEGAERARMARFLERNFRDLFRTAAAVEVGRQSGLLEIATAWLTDDAATLEMARAAAQIIRRLDPGEAYLRQVVLPVAQKARSAEVRASAYGVLGRPGNSWAVDPLVELLIAQLQAEGGDFRFVPPADALRAIGDPRVIPAMIAVIEADDTHASIYGVGYYGLSRLTGVTYDATHDGRWWRDWWEKNRERFPETVRGLAIPELKKRTGSRSPRETRPAETTVDPGEAGEGLDPLLRKLVRLVTTHDLQRIDGTLGKIRALKNPRAIPTLIACIRFDDTQDTHYGIGHFGLSGLTGVRYDESHDGDWWRNWWEKNRDRFGPDVARLEIPQLERPQPAPPEMPADPRVAELRHHAFPVRSIRPDDEDFSDLMPLARKIGRARIVQLGEPSHGDGATFLAKCRLVRFLHQKLGFDVLAWESGLIDCRRMEEALRSDLPLQEAVRQGIFPIWGRSGHVLPVFEYARKTHGTRRPLEMAGFDCQFSGAGGGENFVRGLFQLLARLDPAADLDGERKLLLRLVQRLNEPEYAPAEGKRERNRKTIASLRDRLARVRPRQKTLAREAAFYAQALRSLAALEEMRAQPGTTLPSGTNLRDRQMAENLLWLARRRYPGRKIIVWAASFHLARNLPKVEVPDGSLDYRTTVPMGHTVHEKLGEQVYTIAFSAYSGTRGNPFQGSFRLQEAEPGSLEELCHQTGQPHLLIDLRSAPRSHWLRRKLPARPLGYHPMRAAWGEIFDAILFTDTMFASSESGRVPAWAREASGKGK